MANPSPPLAASPQFREDAFAVRLDAVGALKAHKAVKKFFLERIDDGNTTKLVCSLVWRRRLRRAYLPRRTFDKDDARSQTFGAGRCARGTHGNRDTSRDEAAFVQAFSAWLGVPLWLRRIDILQKRAAIMLWT